MLALNVPAPSLAVVSVRPGEPPSVASDQLFRRDNTLRIHHGDQVYTLRVTRDNKLILTK